MAEHTLRPDAHQPSQRLVYACAAKARRALENLRQPAFVPRHERTPAPSLRSTWLEHALDAYAVSDDGRYCVRPIRFMSCLRAELPATRMEVFDLADARRLQTFSVGGLATVASWSPDAGSIALAYSGFCRTRVVIVDPQRGTMSRLSRWTSTLTPLATQCPLAFHWAPGGASLLIREAAVHDWLHDSILSPSYDRYSFFIRVGQCFEQANTIRMPCGSLPAWSCEGTYVSVATPQSFAPNVSTIYSCGGELVGRIEGQAGAWASGANFVMMTKEAQFTRWNAVNDSTPWSIEPRPSADFLGLVAAARDATGAVLAFVARSPGYRGCLQTPVMLVSAGARASVTLELPDSTLRADDVGLSWAPAGVHAHLLAVSFAPVSALHLVDTRVGSVVQLDAGSPSGRRRRPWQQPQERMTLSWDATGHFLAADRRDDEMPWQDSIRVYDVTRGACIYESINPRATSSPCSRKVQFLGAPPFGTWGCTWQDKGGMTTVDFSRRERPAVTT